MRFIYRLVLIALVVAIIGGMGVHYESNVTTHWPYPTDEELATEYDAHIGETTLLFGTVESTTGDTASITVESDTEDYKLRIQSFEASVSEGGVVQVFGEVRPNSEIVAHNVVVVNPATASRFYKYAVSLVGAGLVVALFFRHWSVNLEKRRLEADDG
jgi:2-hydroxychromene-2-carboxylate isomerase